MKMSAVWENNGDVVIIGLHARGISRAGIGIARKMKHSGTQ